MKSIPRKERIVSSALWAAYGDALGFISELVDRDGLMRRVGVDKVTRTTPWKRRIGGRYGPIIQLPSGTYSDDTQLRLATCRAIGDGGHFDVQAFSKIELTIFPSYGLGAGKGTKAAAVNLAKNGVAWFSNFFKDKSTSYFEGGGNGAAMRIQPHVWSLPSESKVDRLISAVTQNTISTHGHPRAIVGAIFHALTLWFSLNKGYCPKIADIRELFDHFDEIRTTLSIDEEISFFWIPAWEERNSSDFQRSVNLVVTEMLRDLDILSELSGTREEKYYEALKRLGCLEDSQRGSGSKTALISAYLAGELANDDANFAVVLASNALNSDTDTIASMAGALVGSVACDSPDEEILDRDYIVAEAERMAQISTGEEALRFVYPDLFSWQPPKTQLDSVTMASGSVSIRGLGPAKSEGEIFAGLDPDREIWQKIETEFRQTLFIKRRPVLADSQKRKPISRREPRMELEKPKVEKGEQLELGGIEKPFSRRSIDELSSQVIASSFEPSVIGDCFLEITVGPRAIENAIAFAAIITKARIARVKKMR